MLISRILELLGDEEITPKTVISLKEKDVTIMSVDIMEIILKQTKACKPPLVEDLLKLILEGTIVGSTEIFLDVNKEDPFELEEDLITEEQIILTPII